MAKCITRTMIPGYVSTGTEIGVDNPNTLIGNSRQIEDEYRHGGCLNLESHELISPDWMGRNGRTQLFDLEYLQHKYTYESRIRGTWRSGNECHRNTRPGQVAWHEKVGRLMAWLSSQNRTQKRNDACLKSGLPRPSQRYTGNCAPSQTNTKIRHPKSYKHELLMSRALDRKVRTQ